MNITITKEILTIKKITILISDFVKNELVSIRYVNDEIIFYINDHKITDPYHINGKIVIRKISREYWNKFIGSLENPGNLYKDQIVNNAESIIQLILDNKSNILFN